MGKRDFRKRRRGVGTWLLIIVLLATSSSVMAQSAKVHIGVGKTTISSLIEQIEKQTSYLFVYSKNEINVDAVVSLQPGTREVSVLLRQAFDKSDIKYTFNDGYIVLSKKPLSVAPRSHNGRSHTVQGTILDEKDEPVVGASVQVKGTKMGVVSDIDGKFKIDDAPDNATLVISYVGFETQTVPARDGMPIRVKMKEDDRTLNDVIVIGYGTQKKVNLTGSVATVDTKKLDNRAQDNILTAVQGMIPGVTVISRPGQDPSINFRGRGNLGTSAPLYVIDGAISDATFFANLDPTSIESISFLKDAASSSIYGSRAAYGVILVTTKQGSEGKMNVTYSGLVGTDMITYKPDFVNSWEYAELYNEAKYNSNPSGGKNQVYSNEEIELFRNGSQPDLYPNTQWTDLCFDNNAPRTQHSLNFSGGTRKLRYFAGLGYLYGRENLRQRHKQRYNFNLNVSADIANWLALRASMKYIQRTRNVDGGTPAISNMIIVPCTFVAKQSNGYWGSVDGGKENSQWAGSNPLRTYSFGDWSKAKRERSMYEISLDVKPVKDLVVTAQLSYKSMEDKEKSYVATRQGVPSFLNEGQIVSGTATTTNYMTMNWYSDSWLTYTLTAHYNKTLGEHHFEILGGASYEHYQYENLMGERGDFPADSFKEMSAGASSGVYYQNGSDSYEYKMMSYFGRLNYSYRDRYLFEADFRADASSRFHKDHRWGYFPSFSAAWRITEENFMKSSKNWLDNLKLRVSYGTLGNINNVGNYDYFANYATLYYTYSFNDTSVMAISESKPANTTLGWEKVAITDIGLDFGLFGDKLTGTIDYYYKKTSDILLSYNVPLEAGISQKPSQNIAKVRNTGLEMALAYHNSIGKLSYNIGGNFTINQNRILDLGGSDNIIQNLSGHGVAKYILRKGEAIGSFYGFKTDGLYIQEDIDAGRYYTYGGVTPNAGDIKYIPQRKLEYGEAITNDDRTIIGNDVPKVTYGLSMGLAYGDFDLQVNGQGTGGTNVAFEVYQMHPFFHGQDNPRRFHMNRWTEKNMDSHAVYPRIYDASSPHTTYNRAFSDYQIFDADYFRIKTITFGYTVPKTLVTRIGLSTVKFYVTAENFFTIRADHKVKDFDPETAGSVVSSLGTKSLAFGVNVSF